MKRPVLLFAVLAVFAVAAVGCGDRGGEPAAVVNGEEISQDAVIDELEAIRDNTDYLEGLQAGGQEVVGNSEGSFSAPFAAETLTNRVRYALVAQELERREVTLSEECRNAARESKVAELGAAVGSDASRGDVVLEAFPRSYQDELIDRTANVLALQGDLVDLDCAVADAVDQFYDDQPDQFRQACVSLITVASEEDATDVKAELDDGADFAALAQDESLDAYADTGGDIGCLLRSAFNDAPDLGAAVFAATPGVAEGPVQSPLGWHAFVVREQRTPALDEVRDQAPALLSAYVSDRFQEWFTAAVDDAEVEVDSHYGQWDPVQGQIVAPGSPTPESTTTIAPPPAGG